MTFLKQRSLASRDRRQNRVAGVDFDSGAAAPETSGNGDRMELLSRDEIRCLNEWLSFDADSRGSRGARDFP